MSAAVILQHAPYAGPGRIVPVFRDFGIPLDIRRVYRGDEVPTDLEDIRVLISLGGPMSVKDADNTQMPFLSQEVALLKRLIALDRPVLGIGLGAQLLAHAGGAKVYPNAKPPAVEGGEPTLMPEFGWGGVSFPFPGGTEPMVYGMVDGMPMFHWHTDTFDIPRLPSPANPAPPPAPPPPTGNSLLSSSRTCKNQAYRFKNRLFGFQYHFEMTESDIEALLANDKDGVAKLGADGAARIREETKQNYVRYDRLGKKLLTNFVQFLKAY